MHTAGAIFALVYRILAILLLTCFIWVQTPVGQLLKVSALIEHYHEHKSENSKLDIIGFLYAHYAHHADHYPTHDKDMKLPFKQCSPIAFAIGILQQVKFVVPEKVEYVNASQTLFQYKSTYQPKEAIGRIWQPPRA